MDAYSRRAVVFLLLLFIFTGFVVKVERSMLGSILPPQSASSPDKSDSADKSWASDSIWQRLFGSAPAVVETRGLQKPSSPAFNDPADIIPQAEEPTCKTLPDESHQVTTRGLPPCPSSHQDFPMWAILMIQPTKCASFPASLTSGCESFLLPARGAHRRPPPPHREARSLWRFPPPLLSAAGSPLRTACPGASSGFTTARRRLCSSSAGLPRPSRRTSRGSTRSRRAKQRFARPTFAAPSPALAPRHAWEGRGG